jgi:hypothetical protein
MTKLFLWIYSNSIASFLFIKLNSVEIHSSSFYFIVFEKDHHGGIKEGENIIFLSLARQLTKKKAFEL